jgi:hypothetical protein
MFDDDWQYYGLSVIIRLRLLIKSC